VALPLLELATGTAPSLGSAWEPYGAPNRTAMPDPSEELITILVEIHHGTRQARPSGRLRPLLVGRPHPTRRMGRCCRADQATISAALARSKAAAAPLELAHG
jgi:hypothetical protein